MERVLPWLNRDDPGYDPNRIGAITEAKVVAALIAAGKMIWFPGFKVGPADLGIEENGRFCKVQCKTGRLSCGAIVFRPHRLRAAKRETGWRRRVQDYVGEVDLFGVYCPENDKVYLVPIADVTTKQACYLRLDPPKNNQNKNIRWAKEYVVVPLPMQEMIGDDGWEDVIEPPGP